MTASSVSLRSALTPVSSLLLGTGLLYLGFGLQVTLVPLRADAEGFGGVAVGLLGATYYAGFVAGCLFAPFVILRAGHIRAFAAMVSCVSASVLAFPLLVGEVSWVLFRFLVGFCISGVLVIIESWLNEKSTTATRGAVMSAYVIITYAGLTLGQLGVTTQPLDAFTLFAVCSILLSVAAVPVALTRASQPAPIPIVQFRPKVLWERAPAGFVGALASGLTIGSVLSLSAVFAVMSGLSTSSAALFASAIVFGGAIGQYPFGRTSDFVDRRFVMFVSACGTAALSLALITAPALTPAMVMGIGLLFGFVTLPIYSLAAAHAFDWTEYEDMVETSAGMNLMFGVGSTIGPVLASIAMTIFGAAGLFIVTTAASVGLGLFIAARIFARAKPADDMRNDFDLYATAPMGAVPTEIEHDPDETPETGPKGVDLDAEMPDTDKDQKEGV
ncbi:MAG: MFS transporter [Pseudomonadota bacterium]